MRILKDPKRILFLLAGGLAAVLVVGSTAALAAPKQPTKGATPHKGTSSKRPRPSRRKSPPAPASPADSGSPGTDVVTGELLAISTDRQGRIQNVTLQTDAGRKAFAGCGAKLVHLPHVAGALGRPSARVSVFLHDACISSYVVAK